MLSCNKYLIIILIIILIKLLLKLPKVNYKIYRKIFNEKEVKYITECFDENYINKKCYKKRQIYLLKKIKEAIGVNYMNIGHARYSHGNKNFDAQSFHKDIKPSFINNFTRKHPKVYTIVIAFDKLYHQQGKDKLILESGDFLLFNSFNLHRGYNTNISKTNNRRRILQLFHVFFDNNEKIKLMEEHKFSEHINNDFVLKNLFNDKKFSLDFIRTLFEKYNMAQVISFKKAKYITLIDKNNKIGNINGIDYFYKF